MLVDRRGFLHTAGITAAGLMLTAPATPLAAAAEQVPPGRLAPTPEDVPRTGFEKRHGAGWTTHEEELEFLTAVAMLSGRIGIDEAAKSVEGRPMHLVRLGEPKPPASRNRHRPAALFIGSQHGNEPAGREAMLIALRDLAFTNDAELVRQMREQQFLIIPTANPDGRTVNTRANANGVDLNRDHLTLSQPETQFIHTVARDWYPDTVADHHEYRKWAGPLETDIRYLWPRDLNVDPAVRSLSRTLCEDYIARGARSSGWTADEYWRHSVGPHSVYFINSGEPTTATTTMGLRHSLSVLIESVREGNLEDIGGEGTTSPENKRDRVARHVQAVDDTLRFHRDYGDRARGVSADAAILAAQAGADRSRPTYWGGTDNDPPEDDEIDDPPPCRYELTHAQADEMATVLDLHAITIQPSPSIVAVPMGQAARPVIPLLLDERSDGSVTSGRPIYECD